MGLRRRGRKEREVEPDLPPERDPDPAPGPAGHQSDEDLSSRLDAVTSNFSRPPTAEELRAAFRRREDDEETPPPRTDEFTARYPTESLFTATVEDDPPTVEESTIDDRSRTKGDYYYDPEDAWAVLGLQSGASWKEIAAAHRRLAMQHHPDRLLDASAEQRAASEETMREVNVAYSVLRRLTGH